MERRYASAMLLFRDRRKIEGIARNVIAPFIEFIFPDLGERRI